MTFSFNPYVIALDGGGTRCRLALVSEVKTIRIDGDAANVSSSFEAARDTILDCIARLSEQSGLTADEVASIPAYLGLAGICGAAITDRLRDALPFEHVRIEDDRRSALHGAFSSTDGFLAHCGTGSFLAVQSDGQSRFVGGWGPVLGDQASARWMGIRALSRCLDTIDGFAPETNLTRTLLDRYGGAAGVVEFAGRASPAEVGVIAQDVTEHAARKDTVAVGVLADGAQEITEALRNLGWMESDRVCLTGGLGPCYAEYLPDEMKSALVAPEGSPMDGAIALARDFAGELSR